VIDQRHPKLGIIAGGGQLPAQIVEACQASGRPYFVLAIEGHTATETVIGAPHAWVRLGAAARAIEVLQTENVEELVMAGPMRRPSMRELRPDLTTAKFFARLGSKAVGDDGLLGAVVRELEQRHGFRVVGIESVLPGVMATEGVLGAHRPDAQATRDIERGIEVARGVGALDVGQAAVVQEGIVLAVEAIEGTDAMLARAAQVRREGAGGVLVKVRKPGQEDRADLPTIGERTIRAAAEAGLAGIAIEAGGALVVGRDAVIAAADAADLFVIGIPIPDDER